VAVLDFLENNRGDLNSFWDSREGKNRDFYTFALEGLLNHCLLGGA